MASGGNLAGQIDNFLTGYGSPMAGLGKVYVAAGKKWGVDPRLPAAISIAESSGGKHILGSYNAWGWGPGNSFTSWADGINTVTRGLKTGYLNQGLTTPATIVSKWAPASDGNDEQHWSQLVSEQMRAMGASPNSSAALAKSMATMSSTVPTSTAVPSLQAALASLQSAPRSTSGLQQAALTNLSRIASSGHASGTSLLSGLVYGVGQDRQIDQQRQQQINDLSQAIASTPQAPPQANDATPTPPTQGPTGSTAFDASKWVKEASGADRQGVKTHQKVLDAVARVAQQFGTPLTITTGSNHNQFVVGTNRQSQHWVGDAADIAYGHGTGPDNVDPSLTRLGQAALIAAGMDPTEAHQQTGGVFNVGGWNILFNTMTGGNHYNHLHVGVH